jgi:predicted transcriptional regulator
MSIEEHIKELEEATERDTRNVRRTLTVLALLALVFVLSDAACVRRADLPAPATAPQGAV